MGSVGNQRNFPPYDSYRDCSLGICSIYCPQWCYIIFPPPPPFEPQDDDSGGGANFSPLIIAVIGILVSAFLLVSYYTIISKYCKRRNRNRNQLNPTSEFEVNQNQLTHDQWQLATGLDESVIKSIAVFKFVKGDGLIDGSDCAVCLSEFQENESLRLLPKCSHAFHVPCIDTWLRSHSNCPLCRSNVTIPVAPPPPSSNLNISSLELQRRNETILVVEERESRGYREEVVVTFVSENLSLTSFPKYPSQGENGVEEFRRSASFSCNQHQANNSLLISDILKINDEDDYDADDELQGSGSCSSNGDRPSLTTGRFMNGKGKKSIVPN